MKNYLQVHMVHKCNISTKYDNLYICHLKSLEIIKIFPVLSKSMKNTF